MHNFEHLTKIILLTVQRGASVPFTSLAHAVLLSDSLSVVYYCSLCIFMSKINAAAADENDDDDDDQRQHCIPADGGSCSVVNCCPWRSSALRDVTFDTGFPSDNTQWPTTLSLLTTGRVPSLTCAQCPRTMRYSYHEYWSVSLYILLGATTSSNFNETFCARQVKLDELPVVGLASAQCGRIICPCRWPSLSIHIRHCSITVLTSSDTSLCNPVRLSLCSKRRYFLFLGCCHVACVTDAIS